MLSNNIVGDFSNCRCILRRFQSPVAGDITTHTFQIHGSATIGCSTHSCAAQEIPAAWFVDLVVPHHGDIQIWTKDRPGKASGLHDCSRSCSICFTSFPLNDVSRQSHLLFTGLLFFHHLGEKTKQKARHKATTLTLQIRRGIRSRTKMVFSHTLIFISQKVANDVKVFAKAKRTQA